MRKIKTGTVVSDKMDKTRLIKVEWTAIEPRYGKILKHNTRIYAHDEKNQTHIGDKVQVIETRPISKNKRWKILKAGSGK